MHGLDLTALDEDTLHKLEFEVPAERAARAHMRKLEALPALPPSLKGCSEEEIRRLGFALYKAETATRHLLAKAEAEEAGPDWDGPARRQVFLEALRRACGRRLAQIEEAGQPLAEEWLVRRGSGVAR